MSEPQFRLTALPIPDAARLLTKVYNRPVTEAMLRRAIDEGAPTSRDGTLNIVELAAWLVQEANRGD